MMTQLGIHRFYIPGTLYCLDILFNVKPECQASAQTRPRYSSNIIDLSFNDVKRVARSNYCIGPIKFYVRAILPRLTKERSIPH